VDLESNDKFSYLHGTAKQLFYANKEGLSQVKANFSLLIVFIKPVMEQIAGMFCDIILSANF